MKANRYTTTVDTTAFSNDDYAKLRIGQWVNIMGLKGQYLGITAANIVTINYKKAPNAKAQFTANRPLRQFAKLMGSF
jgi:hypothetical protein